MKTMKIRANKAGNAMENAELQLQVSPDISLWLRGTVVAALWSRGIAGGDPQEGGVSFPEPPAAASARLWEEQEKLKVNLLTEFTLSMRRKNHFFFKPDTPEGISFLGEREIWSSL